MYKLLVYVEAQPLTKLDEEGVPLSYKVVSERSVPGQNIPDGDYTRQPHIYDANPVKVHLEDGELKAGWK
jgi:hypothetical protein